MDAEKTSGLVPVPDAKLAYRARADIEAVRGDHIVEETEPEPSADKRLDEQMPGSGAEPDAPSFAKVNALMRDYDRTSLAKTYKKQMKMRAREFDVEELSQRDMQKAQNLRRELLATMTRKEPMREEDIARVVGLCVAMLVLEDPSKKMEKQHKRDMRAKRVNHMLAVCDQNVMEGRGFMWPFPASMNDVYRNSIRGNIGRYANEHGAHQHTPVSLETIGEYGLALKIKAVNDVANGMEIPEARAEYRREYEKLCRVAELDKYRPDDIDRTVWVMANRMADADGYLPLGYDLENPDRLVRVCDMNRLSDIIEKGTMATRAFNFDAINNDTDRPYTEQDAFDSILSRFSVQRWQDGDKVVDNEVDTSEKEQSTTELAMPASDGEHKAEVKRDGMMMPSTARSSDIEFMSRMQAENAIQSAANANCELTPKGVLLGRYLAYARVNNEVFTALTEYYNQAKADVDHEVKPVFDVLEDLIGDESVTRLASMSLDESNGFGYRIDIDLCQAGADQFKGYKTVRRPVATVTPTRIDWVDMGGTISDEMKLGVLDSLRDSYDRQSADFSSDPGFSGYASCIKAIEAERVRIEDEMAQASRDNVVIIDAEVEPTKQDDATASVDPSVYTDEFMASNPGTEYDDDEPSFS